MDLKTTYLGLKLKNPLVPSASPLSKNVDSMKRQVQKIANDAEFKKIMSDLGQPVDYMNAAEYKAWFKKSYDQFGELYKTLGIETK